MAARDLLGRMYEYFLGQFAGSEGKRGGEFYTPPVRSCARWWKCSNPTKAASNGRAKTQGRMCSMTSRCSITEAQAREERYAFAC